MCAHLLDNGWKEPRCVDACPTDALRFGEEEDLKEWIEQAEVLHPEFNAKPRVYYMGLPDKRFIAGAVYDPEEDICIHDARATLTKIGSNEQYTAMTDNYGDFWFEDLAAGDYSLIIEKEGYHKQKIVNISAEKDVNLGDIGICKAG